MREKLIQIIGRYTPRYLGGIKVDVADVILAAFRCDGCRYWGKTEATETFSGGRLCMHMNGPVTSKPDFFCAYWEGKQ